MQVTDVWLGGGREVALYIIANSGGSSKWFIWEKGCLERILEVLWLPETLSSLDAQQLGCSQHLQVKKNKPWNRLAYIICFSFIGNRHIKSLLIFVCYSRGWSALKLTIHLFSEYNISLCILWVCVTFCPFSNGHKEQA